MKSLKPEVATTTSAIMLGHVPGSVTRQVRTARAQRNISKYGPAKVTQSRLDFSGKSQASLTLQARRRRAASGLQESKASERPDEALDVFRGGVGAEMLPGPLADDRHRRQPVELARDEVLRLSEPEESP